MKFGNLDITDVSHAVFKTIEHNIDDYGNDDIKVKTTAWERRPSDDYIEIFENNNVEEYVWVCVNHRINGVDAPSKSVGQVKPDSEFIQIMKKIYNSPKYKKWFHRNTMNMKIETYKRI